MWISIYLPNQEPQDFNAVMVAICSMHRTKVCVIKFCQWEQVAKLSNSENFYAYGKHNIHSKQSITNNSYLAGRCMDKTDAQLCQVNLHMEVSG